MLREPGTAGINRQFERLFKWISSTVDKQTQTMAFKRSHCLQAVQDNRPERLAGY